MGTSVLFVRALIEALERAGVSRHVLDTPASGRHDMPAVARALGLSARSLRRRLIEEGTTFREVVDSALGTLARRLVSDEERAIEDAAYAMGFSHPSAFHRAFKRWTGATPAALRARDSRPPPAPEPTADAAQAGRPTRRLRAGRSRE